MTYHYNNSNYSTLDSIIKEVKRDFQSILVKRKELVLKLGNAFEGAVSDPESICEEIKNTLKEEIADKLISARNIEIYCLKPTSWQLRRSPLINRKFSRNLALQLGSNFRHGLRCLRMTALSLLMYNVNSHSG
jgi:hypothetical protein